MRKSKTHIWDCNGPARRFVTLVLAVLAVALASCRARETIDVQFYYMETCPGCETYQAAERIAGMVASLGARRGFITSGSYNVINQDFGNRLVTLLRERELPDVSYSLPILVIDDSYVVGYEEIEEEMLRLLDEYPLRRR